MKSKALDIIKYAKKQAYNYHKQAGTLLKVESVTKSRRYGVDFYRNQFIRHPEKSFSSYMNTFLYLRSMEDSYREIKEIYENQLPK